MSILSLTGFSIAGFSIMDIVLAIFALVIGLATKEVIGNAILNAVKNALPNVPYVGQFLDLVGILLLVTLCYALLVFLRSLFGRE